MGLLGWRQVPSGFEVTASSSFVTVRGLLAGLLLFVGFELALFTTPSTAGSRRLQAASWSWVLSWQPWS